jgi:precorrin-2/cobalt-factor-2 C20-methyltransferase
MITAGEYRDFDGTLIIMKAGKNLKKLKEEIKACSKKAWLVENCGMAEERIYSDLEAMPDEAGYFSILLVKP